MKTLVKTFVCTFAIFYMSSSWSKTKPVKSYIPAGVRDFVVLDPEPRITSDVYRLYSISGYESVKTWEIDKVSKHNMTLFRRKISFYKNKSIKEALNKYYKKSYELAMGCCEANNFTLTGDAVGLTFQVQVDKENYKCTLPEIENMKSKIVCSKTN